MKSLFRQYHIGHFINKPDQIIDFAIAHFANMAEPDVDDVHRHTFYEIIWVEEGKSTQVIDYQSYRLSPGSLFFISPGQVHSFETWHSIRGGSIFFTADFYLHNQASRDNLFELSFLDNSYSNPLLCPDPATYQSLLATIQWLGAEYANPMASRTILQALLQILLAQVQRYMAQHTRKIAKRSLLIYKSFIQDLDMHFFSGETASIYASRLNISQHHLNRICHEVAGKTVTAVIRERIVLEAKRMLVHTDDTVTEIAAMLGFPDNSYFTRVFKSMTGMQPLSFRMAMSEKYQSL